MFEASVDSLRNYECPEWFRDAKFGIYLHWGVYSVAEQGEWYPRQMYIEGSRQHQYHCQHYGHPSEVGYKDLVPLWKAERFDPDWMLSLFKKAGARYFAPCAIHHDNFDLWNSRHNRWNAANMGPKKDLIGLFREATLKAGLRFGVTTHLARAWSWLQTNKDHDRSGPYKGVPYDGNDPDYQDFYLPPDVNGDDNRQHPMNPPQVWRTHWAARIKDLIDNYHPDHLYFDGAIPFQGEDRAQTGLEVIAHYYNHNMARHDGKQEGVMFIKMIPRHGYYFEGVTSCDFERTRSGSLMTLPWQTDTSVGPWGYDTARPYRPVPEIIHELADIVSKNGNMLLNVPPKADGTLDKETVSILEAIGQWLGVNGEAIYGTRPWERYTWARSQEEQNVCFTTKGDAFYAISLVWPEDGQLRIPVLGLDYKGSPVQHVELLGSPAELTWTQDDTALTISLPPGKPCDHAWAFKLDMPER
jgi:alpha-L-fucosidase